MKRVLVLPADRNGARAVGHRARVEASAMPLPPSPSPTPPVPSSHLPAFALPTMTAASGLVAYARRVLTSPDPADKVRLTSDAAIAWAASRHIGPHESPPSQPARPSLPKIVSAGEMPSAKQSKAPGNVYVLHGLAHVELNAIDLCFDTMLRFASGVPPGEDAIAWYDDWISIAADEARHFSWLDARLRQLGSSYGALPAHGLIWEGADASAASPRERLAVGQLVAEAKGLDAAPRLAERLIGAGDKASADIVHTIAEEEVRHVQIGIKWFLWECERAGVDPVPEFHDIALRLANPGAFARPFNEQRRAMAGMTPEWYLPVAQVMEQMRAERRAELKSNHNPTAQPVAQLEHRPDVNTPTR